MNSSFNGITDGVRAQLRAAIVDMNDHLEHLLQKTSSEDSAKDLAAAMASSATLVKLLALEPEPLVRECPACKRTVMRAAKLCGYCWAKLQPLSAQPLLTLRT